MMDDQALQGQPVGSGEVKASLQCRLGHVALVPCHPRMRTIGAAHIAEIRQFDLIDAEFFGGRVHRSQAFE